MPSWHSSGSSSNQCSHYHQAGNYISQNLLPCTVCGVRVCLREELLEGRSEAEAISLKQQPKSWSDEAASVSHPIVPLVWTYAGLGSSGLSLYPSPRTWHFFSVICSVTDAPNSPSRSSPPSSNIQKLGVLRYWPGYSILKAPELWFLLNSPTGEIVLYIYIYIHTHTHIYTHTHTYIYF